jgi:DNA-binding Lrp family transcriptional regulator
MDERDLQILTAIAELETGNTGAIHEETGIPESTIYYRLNNLRNEGIIENDLYDVDWSKLGLNMTVIAEVHATYEEEYHTRVGEKLSNVEGVSQVYFTMGETDFLVIAHLADREMVEDLIGDFEAIEEVSRTQSTFVVTTIKDEPRLLKNYDMETLLEKLDDRSEE